MPTNTGTSLASGITREIVAIGTTDGVPCIDLRFSGTPATTTANAVSMNAVAPATNGVAYFVFGETADVSLLVQLLAGTLTNITNPGLGFSERDNAGVALQSGLSLAMTPTATLSMGSYTRTMQQAGCATYGFNFRWTYGDTVTPVDFTIRLAAPRLTRRNRSVITAPRWMNRQVPCGL